MTATSEKPRTANSDWRQLREQILRRDQYRCQHCGRHEGMYSSTDLQAHHIQPVSRGGEGTAENLITLCNRCHNRLHDRFDDDHERLPAALLEECEPATISPSTYRTDVSGLPDVAQEVVDILKKNGPTQLKDIAAQSQYKKTSIQGKLDTLKFGNLICRVERGVYAYVTEIEYRRMLAEGRDDRGNYTVRVWNPGEQAKLDDFKTGGDHG